MEDFRTFTLSLLYLHSFTPVFATCAVLLPK